MTRAFRDSGIEWIGTIPSCWNLLKGKFLFSQRNTKGNDVELQLLSPTQKFGVIPQTLYEELSTNKAVKVNQETDLSTFKTIRKGDFCISLRSFQGGFEYSQYDGVVSPAYQVFYATAAICNEYYKYLFKDGGFIAEMNSFTLSLRDGKNISFDDFGNSYIPVPPLPEQRRIAAFLDAKCAETDALAADIRAEIETLEEYRKSVITEAVTKGLDPNAKMKDSGVPWIGKIPETWRTFRIAELYEDRNERGNDTLPLLSVSINTGVSDKELSAEEQDRVFYGVKIKPNTSVSILATLRSI